MLRTVFEILVEFWLHRQRRKFTQVMLSEGQRLLFLQISIGIRRALTRLELHSRGLWEKTVIVGHGILIRERVILHGMKRIFKHTLVESRVGPIVDGVGMRLHQELLSRLL